MAFEIISQPAGFCLADDIFFYKIKDTSAVAFSTATWTLILKDNDNNEYEYQYTSIYFADKTTYLNISDMVRALATQLRSFPDADIFALASYVQVYLNVNSTSGTYTFNPCFSILGQFSANQKDFLPINGLKSFTPFFANGLIFKAATNTQQYALNNSYLLSSFYIQYYGSFKINYDFYENNTLIRSEEFAMDSLYAFDNNISIFRTYNHLVNFGDLSSENITRIVATLQLAIGIQKSESIYYTVQYQNETDNRRVFVFRNKKGGAQVLHTNGTETIRVAQAANRLEGTFQEKDYSQRQNTKQVVYNTSDETIYETSTGYMNKPQFDNITDIFYAQDVWLWENEKFVAVEIDNNASEKFDNNNGIFYAKLAWKYGYR